MCNSFNKNEIKLFNSVTSVSLTRIFAQYDVNKKQNEWMKDLKFSTINNPIKQIIPIRPKYGLFQISYSDWYFADYWGKLKENAINNLLIKFLSDAFQYRNIDKPLYIKKYYWKNAIHFWKPSIDINKYYEQIMNLRKNIHIVGESFSKNQGWCEGAIQTTIELMDQL
tara:strand:+ start:143 stop:646 length:504 start_codon:yes stop_codon:yes gene_type:complete